MGSKPPWFVLAGLLACTAPPPTPLTLSDAPIAPPPVEPRPPGPESKLKLEIAIKGGFTVIEVGRHIEIEATIRNISPEPQKIVLSGDGSEAGWREPHVGFIAERAAARDLAAAGPDAAPTPRVRRPRAEAGGRLAARGPQHHRRPARPPGRHHGHARALADRRRAAGEPLLQPRGQPRRPLAGEAAPHRAAARPARRDRRRPRPRDL